MAQWKSVPFTPERSLVRSQLGPQYSPSSGLNWGFFVPRLPLSRARVTQNVEAIDKAEGGRGAIS